MNTLKILTIITIWILYAGMVTLAIIFDGIYIQICIDTAIMIVSAIIGYLYKASISKEQS